MLGRAADARGDVRWAFEQSREEPAIVLRFAIEAETDSDREVALRALGELPDAIPERDQVAIAKVKILVARSGNGDLDETDRILRELVTRLRVVQPMWLRADVLRMIIQVWQKRGRGTEARDLIKGVDADILEDGVLELMLGRASQAAGDSDFAKRHSIRACEVLSAGGSWFERRDAALLAQELGLYEYALRVWETLLRDDCTGSDVVHYIRCAYQSGDWLGVLRTCERLRMQERTTRDLLELEVRVLCESRGTARAIDLLQNWLTKNPTDKRIRVQLSYLALQEGRKELAVFDEQLLSTIAEVADPAEGGMVVFIVRHGPNPNRSLDLVYALHRRFPDEIEVRQAAMLCLYGYHATPLVVANSDTVCETSAVKLRRGNEEPRWIYVVSGPDFSMPLGEYAVGHPLVASLMGRRVGDRVNYDGRSYEILAVENRTLRRIHEILGRTEEDFPSSRMFRSFDAPTDPPPRATVEQVLGQELSNFFKNMAREGESFKEAFKEQGLPIAWLSARLGRSITQTMRYLSWEPSLGVRFATGDAREWKLGVATYSRCRRIVIDETVLTSALDTSVLGILPKLGLSITVPRSVHDAVRKQWLEVSSERSPTMSLGFYRDRFIIHRRSAEELAAEASSLAKVLWFLRDHCEIVGGESTLELPPVLRGSLEIAIGVEATDALALARSRGCTLWTDDLGLRHLAADPALGVQCVWSQVVLNRAWQSGTISRRRYLDSLRAFVLRRYRFVHLAAADLAEILEEAEWNLRSASGLTIREYLLGVPLSEPKNLSITLQLLLLLRDACPNHAKCLKLTNSILDMVGSEGVRQLITSCSRLRLDPVNARRLQMTMRTLKKWLSRNDQRHRRGN